MSFELLLIDSLVTNEAFSKKVSAYVSEEYFESPDSKEVFLIIKEFIGKYKNLPTKEALGVILADKKMPEPLFIACSQIISEIGSNPPVDPQFMFDETEEWARERSLYNAIMKSISIIDGSDKTRDKHAIPELMSNALGVNFDSYIGHDYFANAEEQWDYYSDPGERLKFHLDIMNRVTKGGIKKKTLNIVQMGINVGKTTWLIDQAAHFLDMGLNVVYFTLEVDENTIRERSDVNMFEMDFDRLHSLEKTQYLSRVQQLRDKTKGEFIIKEFAAGTAHAGHFRHILNELVLKKGIKPDMICVDYLTLCASSTLPAAAASNSNLYYTKVAEELRGLAKEFKVPLWTATQLNRSGQDTENAKLSDSALSIGIANTADFMVVFMQPEELAPQNKIIGKVLKNRYAGKHKIGKFMLGSDPDLQKFFEVDINEMRGHVDDESFALMNSSSTGSESVKSTTSNTGTWSF